MTPLFTFPTMETIATLLGGALGAKALEYFITKRAKKEQNSAINNLERLSNVYNELETLINETAVERAVIWKGHDSGFAPQPGNPYFVSSLHWSTRLKNKQDSEYIGMKYNNLQVDGHYINMILELIKNKSVSIEVDKMDECMLKNIYMAVDIKYAELYYIHSNANTFFYISLTTSEENEFFDDPVTRNQIDISLSKIRINFQKSMY